MTNIATSTTKISITVTHEFDYGFAHTHYNIYPWIATTDALLRVVRRSEHPVVVSIAPAENSGALSLELHSVRPLSPEEVALVGSDLTWALGLDDSSPDALARLAADDPVIAAALRVNKGIRPKRYLDLFEAICGAICAQNVDFRRLYQMMKALATAFGPAIGVADAVYHAFPLAEEVATRTESELRECKVGYRAKLLLKAATFLAEHGAPLGREELTSCDPEHAMERLCEIPGIGPYSAGIVLGAGVGRSDIFHLDSFTRHILSTFYFKGRKVNDERLRKLAAKRWPGCAGAVAHLLTTNTHLWAADLGYEGFRPSGARRDGDTK
jgi:3-methyladenine DNA glycosylase/8-oxoguanine DNA glycosylase